MSNQLQKSNKIKRWILPALGFLVMFLVLGSYNESTVNTHNINLGKNLNCLGSDFGSFGCVVCNTFDVIGGKSPDEPFNQPIGFPFQVDRFCVTAINRTAEDLDAGVAALEAAAIVGVAVFISRKLRKHKHGNKAAKT